MVKVPQIRLIVRSASSEGLSEAAAALDAGAAWLFRQFLICLVIIRLTRMLGKFLWKVFRPIFIICFGEFPETWVGFGGFLGGIWGESGGILGGSHCKTQFYIKMTLS